MANIFEQSTRVALEEIILKNSLESKFGRFINQDQLETMKDDLLSLLINSRNLRAAGDRFLAGQEKAARPQGAMSRPPFSVSE